MLWLSLRTAHEVTMDVIWGDRSLIVRVTFKLAVFSHRLEEFSMLCVWFCYYHVSITDVLPAGPSEGHAYTPQSVTGFHINEYSKLKSYH